MSVVFEQANIRDIEELVRLRIAYMTDDYGQVSEYEEACMRKQLPEYFSRKLGSELIAFVARDGEKIVAVAQLHMIEMPANPALLNGVYAEVLNVYTEPEYRGGGLCSQLIKNLLNYAKEMGLDRVDLSATKEGYPIYKRLGFQEKENRYTDMRYYLAIEK